MILIGLIGLALDMGFRRLEKVKSVRWGFRNEFLRIDFCCRPLAWLALDLRTLCLSQRELDFHHERLFAAREAEVSTSRLFPVTTCHLACPVTDYISKFSKKPEKFFSPECSPGLSGDQRGADLEQDAGGIHRGASLAIALKSRRSAHQGRLSGPSLRQRRRRPKADGPVKTFADYARPRDRNTEPLFRRAVDCFPRDEEVRALSRK